MRLDRMASRLVALLWTFARVGCAGSVEQNASFDRDAANEIARHPSWYTNGGARAFLVVRDGSARALLWGSVHVNYGSDTMLPRAMRDRFAEAVDLTTEIPFEALSASDLRAMGAKGRRSMETPSTDAVARLDPETRAALDAADLPPGMPSRFSLRGLASLVAGKAAADPLGYTGSTAAVDFILIRFARQRGIVLHGLDTRARTMAANGDDPNGAGAAEYLKRVLRQSVETRAFGPWLLGQYGRGQTQTAVAALGGWGANAGDLVRLEHERVGLLHDRNAAWIPKLETIFATPGLHFVVFGAAHLLGDDGVVALLRGHGWQVLPCPGDICPAT